MYYLKVMLLFLCGALAGVFLPALSTTEQPTSKSIECTDPAVQAQQLNLDHLCHTMAREDAKLQTIHQKAVITRLRRGLTFRNAQLLKLHKRAAQHATMR